VWNRFYHFTRSSPSVKTLFDSRQPTCDQDYQAEGSEVIVGPSKGMKGRGGLTFSDGQANDMNGQKSSSLEIRSFD
jgi:hypothetical protein